jgi:hypothetical protein
MNMYRVLSVGMLASSHVYLHLAALRDDKVLHRLAFGVGESACVLNLGDNVHALNDVAKDDMLAVQVGCPVLGGDDEELAAVGVGAAVLFVVSTGHLTWRSECVPPWRGVRGGHASR